jgi:hypothetical protein
VVTGALITATAVEGVVLDDGVAPSHETKWFRWILMPDYRVSVWVRPDGSGEEIGRLEFEGIEVAAGQHKLATFDSFLHVAEVSKRNQTRIVLGPVRRRLTSWRLTMSSERYTIASRVVVGHDEIIPAVFPPESDGGWFGTPLEPGTAVTVDLTTMEEETHEARICLEGIVG